MNPSDTVDMVSIQPDTPQEQIANVLLNRLTTDPTTKRMLEEFAVDNSHPGDTKYLVLLLHEPIKDIPACTWYRVFAKSHNGAVEMAIRGHEAKLPFWGYISSVVGIMTAAEA